MSRYHRIVWSEGLFLTPQHFQQWDLYQESQLAGMVGMTRSWPWGLDTLEIDAESLARGVFRLLSCSGLFPGGTLVRLPDLDPVPPSVTFKDLFDVRADSLDVFLGLPVRRTGWANCLLPGETGEASGEIRYSARSVAVPDENNGRNERPVIRADQNLRILLSTDIRDNFETLPLARVVRSSSGGYQLHPEFTPPLLNIRASAALDGRVKSLLERLATRSTELGARFTDAGADARDITPANLRAFMNFAVVNGAIPPLAHFRNAERVHPEDLFLFLSSLAGQLSTFNARRLNPRDLPDYDHVNAGPVFAALERVIIDLLETEVSEGYTVIPLVPAGEGRFHATFPRAGFFEPGAALILAIAADDLGEAQVQSAARRLVLASIDRIQQKINNRLPGLPINYMSSPPPAIPRRRNTWYFQLESRGSDWEALRGAMNLALDVPADLRTAQLELLGLEGRS